MTVAREVVRGHAVVRVTGEIDMSTADQLRQAVLDAIRGTPERPAVIDLRKIRFLGSAGLQVLADAHREASAVGGSDALPLRVVVDRHRPVVKPIQISGMDRVLALYESLDDAVGR